MAKKDTGTANSQRRSHKRAEPDRLSSKRYPINLTLTKEQIDWLDQFKRDHYCRKRSDALSLLILQAQNIKELKKQVHDTKKLYYHTYEQFRRVVTILGRVYHIISQYDWASDQSTLNLFERNTKHGRDKFRHEEM